MTARIRMDDKSDNSLAFQAAAGDSEAFAELLERHYDRIYRVSARVLFGEGELAADVTQEVCLKLRDKLCSFRGDSQFTTWLYRIVANAAYDALRDNSVRQRIEQNYAETISLLGAGHSSEAEDSDWLYRALSQLSDKLRITVFLVIEEELTHAEAGKVLQIPEKTVSWRMHEVRKQLRVMAANRETER